VTFAQPLPSGSWAWRTTCALSIPSTPSLNAHRPASGAVIDLARLGTINCSSTLFSSTSSCPSSFPPCPRCLLYCVELQRAWPFALEHSLGFTCHQPCHSPASPPCLPASPPSTKQPPQPSLSFCHSNIIHLLWRLHAPNTLVSSHGPLSIICTCPLLPYLCSLRLRRESLLSNRNHVAKQ